jgi:hypothetical protein
MKMSDSTFIEIVRFLTSLSIPILTSATVTGLVLWIAKSWLSARIKKSIENDFDSKLEQLRSELRIKEEELKANTRRRDDQINSLVSGALSGMVSRAKRHFIGEG